MSQRKVTFNLATQALFYKKRAPHLGELVRFEPYESGAETGRASNNTIFYGSGRESSPSPPPPPPAPCTWASPAPILVGCEAAESPCPSPPPSPAAGGGGGGFERPPPLKLNLGGANWAQGLANAYGCRSQPLDREAVSNTNAAGGGTGYMDLPPLKLTRHDYGLTEDEQPPSWNASPISPATHKSWLDKRKEEAAERKRALAAAYTDFLGKITPPNQRTPASVCMEGSNSSRHMSPLNLTPRPNAGDGHLTCVVEETDNDETEAALVAVCEKLKAEHL